MKIEINNGVVNATPESVAELNAIMQFVSAKPSVVVNPVGKDKVQCAWCNRAFQSKRRAFTKHVHTMHKRIPYAERTAFITGIVEPKGYKKEKASYALRGWETRRKNLELRKLKGIGILKDEQSIVTPTPEPKVEDKPNWLM